MLEKGDEGHIEALKKMIDIMKVPDSMQKWYASQKQEFDNI